MEDVPEEPKRDMEFVFVENVQQVFKEALLPAAEKLKDEKPKTAASNGKHHNGKAVVSKVAHKKIAKKGKAKVVVNNRCVRSITCKFSIACCGEILRATRCAALASPGKLSISSPI